MASLYKEGNYVIYNDGGVEMAMGCTEWRYYETSLTLVITPIHSRDQFQQKVEIPKSSAAAFFSNKTGTTTYGSVDAMVTFLRKNTNFFLAERPYETLHLRGRVTATTSFKPVATSATYFTPTAPVALEVVCADANDTAGGTGAQEVAVVYLDALGVKQKELIATNGITAVPMPGSALRVLEYYVSKSGTYASQIASSHAGIIYLREVATPANIWAQINTNAGFGLGVSQMAVTTIPLGMESEVYGITYSVVSNKDVELLLFKRSNILDVSAPFKPMYVENDYQAISGTGQIEHYTKEMISELTDLGCLAKVSTGTADVTVEIEIKIYTI